MPRTRTTTTSTQAIAACPTAILRTRDGTDVPLQGVTAHGLLEGLVFALNVEQRYRNDTSKNLEAVFTFPLPLRAVLLGFDLQIGERTLKAHAVARQEAAEEYEQAIDSGDTAAMIEHDGHGLYTVSLGNLMAGEDAVIRYRYAELLDAHDGHVRLNVPTVIAPRYGNPADAGLEGPAIPGVDVLGEYPFEIRLDLKHISDVDVLRSPSHSIVTTVGEDGLTVRLTRSGFLDRDFVIEIDQAAIPRQALVARDGDGYVALASATLALDAAEQRPLALKILLDCSGSMGGDSIMAAKRALLAILDRLTPGDRISLTRFGSHIEHVTDGLEPADRHTLEPLKTRVGQINADLGGTQMTEALQDVLSLSTPRDRTADVILITDGEIYDVKSVLALVAQSHHRLFAIAIGAAPNEALARSLADQTGGACEFVGPTEDAEAAILRTFKRLRASPRTVGSVQWPSTPDWTAPHPSAVFPGDTLHLLAGFTTQPTGTTDIRVNDEKGQGTVIQRPLAPHLTDGDLLPRLAAARRIAPLDAAAARDLAVKYQLATTHTSFVVVAARADGAKATALPATVAVPQMLAAGWGGSASVRQSVGAVVAMAQHLPSRKILSSHEMREIPEPILEPAPRAEFRARAAARSDKPNRSVTEHRSAASVPDESTQRESQLKALIALGQQQGYLLRSQIAIALPPDLVDPDQVNDLLQVIQDMAIPIRDDAQPQAAAPRHTPPAEPSRQTPLSTNEIMALLGSLQAARQRGDAPPTSLQELCGPHPVPAGVREALSQLQRQHGCNEADVVAVFLGLLATAGAKAGLVDALLTALRGTLLGSRGHRVLRRDMRVRLFP